MVKVKFSDKSKYYDATFKRESEHVVYLNLEKQLTNTSGFIVYNEDMKEVLGDYTSFKTVYRQEGAEIWYSDNGTTEPDKQITITADFRYPNAQSNDAPEEIDVVTNKGTYTLKSPSYSAIVTVKEHEEVEITSSQEVAGFDCEISGYDVVYTYVGIDPTPSVDAQLDALNEAVCELYDMIRGANND